MAKRKPKGDSKKQGSNKQQHTSPNVDSTSRAASNAGSGVKTKSLPSKSVFAIQSGIPLSSSQGRSQGIPSEVDVQDVESRETGSLKVSSKSWYELCRANGRQGSAEMMTTEVVTYVRNDLFPKLKFFMHKKHMVFSNDPKSLCFQICNGMGVPESHACAWWEEYKMKVLETLNSKRADVTACIKRAFMSKF